MSRIRWIPLVAVLSTVLSVVLAGVSLFTNGLGLATLSVALGLTGITLAVLTGKEEESSSPPFVRGSAASRRPPGRSGSTGP